MSRAFVKEPDAGDAAPDMPDRPISEHTNFVTASGLTKIDSEIERLDNDLAKAQADGEKTAIAAVSRDLRYWTARRASAELVPPPTGDEVRFGATATIEREDGRRQTFQITGEDEADPTSGTLSYVAPLARALIGKSAGDDFEFMGETIVVLTVGTKSD